MKVKFFRDNFNARFVWDWKDGEFVTDDPQVIEHYRGLGIRNEDVKPPQRKKAK